MVHLGFYQSWLVNGLNARILQLVKDVLAEAKVPMSEFRVYLTGELTICHMGCWVDWCANGDGTLPIAFWQYRSIPGTLLP